MKTLALVVSLLAASDGGVAHRHCWHASPRSNLSRNEERVCCQDGATEEVITQRPDQCAGHGRFNPSCRRGADGGSP